MLDSRTTSFRAIQRAFEINTRCQKIESILLEEQEEEDLTNYAKFIIKGRWLEAEPIIMKNPYYANVYLREFPEVRNPSKDVPLVLGDYVIMDVPNTITDEQVRKLISIIEPKFTLYSIDCRLYYEPEIWRILQDDECYIITTRDLLDSINLRYEFLQQFNTIQELEKNIFIYQPFDFEE